MKKQFKNICIAAECKTELQEEFIPGLCPICKIDFYRDMTAEEESAYEYVHSPAGIKKRMIRPEWKNFGGR